jgi:exodeoxyribonuclease VII small subunit
MSAKKGAKNPDQELEELPFEEALSQLEDLVDALEGGDLDLESSLHKFETGVKLVRVCSERLKAAELRIQQLEAEVDEPVERPLDLEEES